MKKILSNLSRLLLVLASLLATSSFGQYTQNVVSTLAPGPNVIEKSATTLTLETFQTAVATAWTEKTGGVFNFPHGITPNTTRDFNGDYGVEGRQMRITSSVNMQNITSGTFIVASSPNGTTSSADQSDYTLTLGLFDTNSGLPVVGQAIKQIGFVILSRNNAGYPLDLRVTALFSDDSTEVVTSSLAPGAGVDDTFFGFTAPAELSITSVRFQAFVPGTDTPRANRIGWDDFGFIAGPTDAAPLPQILDVSPAAFTIHNATNGIRFEALTFESVDQTNISLVVNEVDVSAQLIFTGDSTNYSVAYNGLEPDQEYNMTINVTSSGGTATLNRTFYTITNDLVLYDSEGFTDDTLYPLGALQPVTHGRGTWAPHSTEPAEPAQIVDAGGTQGKTLERAATGASRADFLLFPPFASGTMVIEFDAFVSTTNARTIDVSIQPTTGGNVMGSFFAWGEVPGKLAYFDNTTWIPLADIETDWHHVKIVQYISGPAAGTYDVLINGSAVGEKLPWRNAAIGSAFDRFRIQTQNTAAFFEYGRIDNLVVTVGPEDPNAFLPPSIFNIVPAIGSLAGPEDGISFEVSASLPISTNDVVMRIGGLPVALTFGGSQTNLTASYGPLNVTGNLDVEIEASNAAGTTIVPVTVVSTDEPWLVDPADGWVGPWVWTSGAPLLGTDLPLDGTGPYIHLDTATTAARNFMRQYESGVVDTNQPHYIRWKFRVVDPEFDANFAVFNDRVQFFGRNAPRVGASTDASISWSIMASGDAHASGASAGRTFWVFDNVEGNGAFNLANHVDTAVPMVAGDIYSFEVLVHPGDQTYMVAISNETSSASFTSAAPHTFRNLSAPGSAHTFVHFGIQTSGAAESRAFDLDSVFITPSPLAAVTLVDPVRTASSFSFSFISREGISHLVQYKSDLGSPTWTTLETVPGDGTLKTVIHNDPPGDTLFYRINSQ